MVFVKINGLYYHFNEPRTILEACLDPKVNIEIPRFCYHENA
jgi:NADH dehydrogenase/NADH:ubiquinone oxidoreductase subunit G